MIRLTQASRSKVAIAFTVVVCALSMGCQPPRHVQAAVLRDSTEDFHQKLLKVAAENYTLGDLTQPEAKDPLLTGPGRGVPDIQVFSFTMSPNGMSTLEYHFVAAILSTRTYPRLGLRTGMNYILKVTQGANFEYVIVPERANAKMFYLKHRVISSADHEAPPPHLVRQASTRDSAGTRFTEYGVGGCIENCGAGHCGTTDVGDVFTSQDATRWGLPQ